MCLGYFSNEGRPKLDAVLFSTNLSAKGSIKLLLDTGADITSITLKDALRLGFNVDEIVTEENCNLVEGVGGGTKVYPIIDGVVFVFIDEMPELNKTSYHLEFLDRLYLIPTLQMSIFGRDLLQRLDIEISFVPETINLKRNDFGGSGHICFSV